jgi:hypothetical protein
MAKTVEAATGPSGRPRLSGGPRARPHAPSGGPRPADMHRAVASGIARTRERWAAAYPLLAGLRRAHHPMHRVVPPGIARTRERGPRNHSHTPSGGQHDHSHARTYERSSGTGRCDATVGLVGVPHDVEVPIRKLTSKNVGLAGGVAAARWHLSHAPERSDADHSQVLSGPAWSPSYTDCRDARSTHQPPSTPPGPRNATWAGSSAAEAQQSGGPAAGGGHARSRAGGRPGRRQADTGQAGMRAAGQATGGHAQAGGMGGHAHRRAARRQSRTGDRRARTGRHLGTWAREQLVTRAGEQADARAEAGAGQTAAGQAGTRAAGQADDRAGGRRAGGRRHAGRRAGGQAGRGCDTLHNAGNA